MSDVSKSGIFEYEMKNGEEIITLQTVLPYTLSKIRKEDVIARYGGEEFAIILPEIDLYNAKQFAEHP